MARTLNRAVNAILKPYQVDCLGFADLSEHQRQLAEYGGDIVKGYSCGISVGIALPDSIVDFLPMRSDMDVAGEYRIHGYDAVNARLNMIASVLASYLGRRGFRTLPITAADRSNEKTNAVVSHKMIAHIAGIGWIGKSCLLITPQHGPRMRFVSILTNAPFSKIDEPMEQKCGDCVRCAKICPTKAIKGRNYIPGEGRDERFVYANCADYFDEMRETRQYSVCGMCLFVCPYGGKAPEARA